MTTAVIEFIFGFHLTVSFSRKSLRVNASSIQKTVDLEHPFGRCGLFQSLGMGWMGIPRATLKCYLNLSPSGTSESGKSISYHVLKQDQLKLGLRDCCNFILTK